MSKLNPPQGRDSSALDAVAQEDAAQEAAAQEAVAIKAAEATERPRVDWIRCLPFLALHLACLSVIWVGWSPVALIVCLVALNSRVFGVTAFYHRYFSHRAFKTSRLFQFVGALLGNSACQRGPLWWAAHHRRHHQHSDRPGDAHSPHEHGFWWSHMGWFMTRENLKIDERFVRDWMRFPELRLIDRWEFAAPLGLAVGLFGLGAALGHWAPGLGTSGMQMLIWGFLISTILLYHITYTVNSVAHVWGRKRFETRDESRNNFLIALITGGEGWHNNHHHFPTAARQGFYWWEIDWTYYTLVVLSWFRIVWDLKQVPEKVLAEGRSPEAARVARAAGHLSRRRRHRI